MNRDRNAFKAGLFILVAVALSIAIILSIQGAGRLTGPKQVRQARFKLSDDLGGLRVGDEVRVGGYKIGSVQSVQLVNAEDATTLPELVVEFSLPRRLVLREGVKLGVQTTLTGSSVLNFESIGAGAPLGDAVALAGTPDPKSTLLASLGKAAPQIETLVGDAKTVVQGVRTETMPKVASTVEKAGAAMDRAGEAMAEVRDMIGPSKTDFHGTVANLNATTGDLRKKLPELLDQTGGVLKRVDGALVKIQSSLDDVGATMANARDLTGSARELLVANRGKLFAMVASLKTTGDNLKAASAEVRRSPWRLLYKPAPHEMANLNLYDSARQFAEGASDLEDTATALRDTLDSKTANPEDVQKLIVKLDETFTNFKQVEDKLWATVKE